MKRFVVIGVAGCAMWAAGAMAQGAPIGFTLTLPPEITLTESIRVQCKGRVVRVEDASPDGKVTVAAVIEEYEFLRSENDVRGPADLVPSWHFAQ